MAKKIIKKDLKTVLTENKIPFYVFEDVHHIYFKGVDEAQTILTSVNYEKELLYKTYYTYSETRSYYVDWDKINDLDEIPDQFLVKRAIQIAIAGNHSLLLLSSHPVTTAIINAVKKISNINIQVFCDYTTEDGLLINPLIELPDGSKDWTEKQKELNSFFYHSFDMIIEVNNFDFSRFSKFEIPKIGKISKFQRIDIDNNKTLTMTKGALRFLDFCCEKFRVFGKKRETLIKIANTIAKVEKSLIVEENHVSEAINHMTWYVD